MKCGLFSFSVGPSSTSLLVSPLPMAQSSFQAIPSSGVTRKKVVTIKKALDELGFIPTYLIEASETVNSIYALGEKMVCFEFQDSILIVYLC